MTVVVDAGGSNIRSVMVALKNLGVEAKLTTQPQEILAAENVILPGVGSAGTCVERLKTHGLLSVLQEVRAPVLGICIGMQLMFETLREGEVGGLGLISGEVGLLPSAPGRPVPHMGWNRIRARKDDPLLESLNDAWFYFTHSYAAPVVEETLAATEYGEKFSSVVRKNNWWGVQFHPEKSAAAGRRLLQNFLQVKL